jgi:hypothetical protein
MDACHAAGFEPRIFYASLRVESILDWLHPTQRDRINDAKLSNTAAGFVDFSKVDFENSR